MMRKGVEFIVLCAPTVRTQAYLQAIQAANLTPTHIIIYGCSHFGNSVTDNQYFELDIFVPNFDISLQQTICQSSWKVTYIESDDIDGDELNELLRYLSPSLTVYSGFGGQLVPSRTLQSAGNLLHVHSGWLPDYRGSTTLYYSLLEEGQCAASALLLTEDIDDGPILERKHYPAPTKGSDIDYVYDSAIRADLLISVLNNYVAKNELPDPIAKEDLGDMYYVIHPLLKHLAILSMEGMD